MPAPTMWRRTSPPTGSLGSAAPVAVTAVANVLQVGFNDAWPGDADFDDLRFEAVVTPVPATLRLMASGVAGSAW